MTYLKAYDAAADYLSGSGLAAASSFIQSKLQLTGRKGKSFLSFGIVRTFDNRKKVSEKNLIFFCGDVF